MQLARWREALILTVASSFLAPAMAEVALPRVLGDHMVLQRGMPAPIWGTAAPGETVTVTFRDQTLKNTADGEGKWLVRLGPMQAGEPATLTVSGANTLTLRDVVVGEVWVGSGQSNMDTDIGEYPNDELLQAAAKQTRPELRFFRSDVGNGWTQAGPKAFRFSAQLFYFGMLLQKELGVPVGLMEGAVRGSPSAHWISEATVRNDPGIQKAILEREKSHPYAELEKFYADRLEKWTKEVAAARAAGTPEDKLPKSPWKPSPAGATKGQRGDFYEKHIRPMMPFALRGVLWDQGEGGTDIAEVSQDIVMTALIAQWRRDWRQGDFAWLYVQKPSGGGCALDPLGPVNRGADTFAPQPEAPPQFAREANSRLAYLRTMKNTNTFLVTAQDLAPGVHPPNKSGYATRAAQVALGAVYGRPVEYYGPTYDSMKVEGNRLRLRFTHTGQGLTTLPGQKLQGFVLAGEDRRFHWADAVVEGREVTLTSTNVPHPVAARYAWAHHITWANLFNQDGLPAVTFRTDDWNP